MITERLLNKRVEFPHFHETELLPAMVCEMKFDFFTERGNVFGVDREVI
jgi:hypothetical protein